MTARATLLVCVLVSGLARALPGQDSQFGIQGLGTPGRVESVRSRSTGGAFSAFDATTVLNDASLADLPSLTSAIVVGTSYRQVEGPSSTTWLRTSRYPLFAVGGRIGHRLYLGGGFSSYLDKTYTVVTRDSVSLRGVMEPFNDHISSLGGVGDVRLTAATRFGPHVAIGVGVHMLAGSTQQLATRRFDDTASYAMVRQASQVRYDGIGFSAGARLDLTSTLLISAFARSDSRLAQYINDSLTSKNDLPTTVGGALEFAPARTAHVAGSVVWRSWSRAGTNAFNTLSWSAGVELGETRPFRFGVRGGQLPFGPGTTAPTEWGLAVGTGRVFAKGHGILDLGLERLSRSGSGLSETVWTVLIGMTVRP